MTSRSFPSRHKAQQEEEDAAALKLGPGTSSEDASSTLFDTATHSCFHSVYAEFNNAGCLLISEVKYLLENRDKDAPDTVYVLYQHQPAVLSTSFRADIVSSNPNSVPFRPPFPYFSQGVQQDSRIRQDFRKVQHHRLGVGRPRVGLPSSSPFPPAAGTIVGYVEHRAHAFALGSCAGNRS